MLFNSQNMIRELVICFDLFNRGVIMYYRDIRLVINEIRKIIPKTAFSLRASLNAIIQKYRIEKGKNELEYWKELITLVHIYIRIPKEDWQLKILSIVKDFPQSASNIQNTLKIDYQKYSNLV